MRQLDRPLIVTRHARKRIKEMGLTDDRIRAILANPEIEWGSDENNRRVSAGDFVVVFKEDGEKIVALTVLPRWAYMPYVRGDVRADGKLYSELPEQETER